jgi:glycosyltransferase involved in cell wall biosynthesis
MNTPIVSILTTVYNREKYIEACIESVLASTYKDWELIIVDDQSNDNSVAIAQKYAEKDSHIKVYVNETNLGDYHNRNQAASYAQGKYIKYLDADDLIYPHGLELMVQTMEQFPDAALGISQEVAEDLKPYPFLMTPKETFQREFLQRGVLGLGPTGTIIRRDAFEALGGFTGTRYIGDTELWYKLAMHYPVLKMVPGLSFWRQHEDQQIVMEKKDGFVMGQRYKHQISTLQDKALPLSSDERGLALQKIQKRFSRHMLRLIKQGQFSTANDIKKKCGLNWIEVFKYAVL